MATIDYPFDPLPAVNTRLLLEAACVAYRINNGYINQAKILHLRATGDKSKISINRDIANKCIYDFMIGQSSITDIDRELATKCYNFYMAHIMNILSDTTISDFEKKVVEMLNNETVPFTNYSVGIFCYIPKGYNDGMKRKELHEKLNCNNSTAIGTINEKITIDVNVLSCGVPKRSFYKSREVTNSLIKGLTDDNNAISFWLNKPLEVNKKYNITAVVKKHQLNEQYRTFTTMLSKVVINS